MQPGCDVHLLAVNEEHGAATPPQTCHVQPLFAQASIVSSVLHAAGVPLQPPDHEQP
jgi:hypothetical protein